MGPETASKAIVYIVDDDPLIRESFTRMFSSYGTKIVEFADAQGFLDHRRADRPGCLLLDYQMPDTDGLELQQELITRQDDIPIIFMTAHGDIPTSVKAVRSGAVDFLTKPVERQILLDSVRIAIDQHIQRRADTLALRDIRAKIAGLTRREYEVLEMVVEGLLNKQIAKRLGIAERTVKEHRHQMMNKMDASSIANLARMWERARMDSR